MINRDNIDFFQAIIKAVEEGKVSLAAGTGTEQVANMMQLMLALRPYAPQAVNSVPAYGENPDFSDLIRRDGTDIWLNIREIKIQIEMLQA